MKGVQIQQTLESSPLKVVNRESLIRTNHMGKETWTDLEGNDWKKSVKEKKREVLTFKMMIIVHGNKDAASLPRGRNLFNKGLKGKYLKDNICLKKRQC